MQLGHYRKQAIQALEGRYGPEESRAIFGRLTEDICGFPSLEWVVRPERELSGEELSGLNQAMNQLRLGRPVQYVTGRTSFMGLNLRVREGVLIPRPETEDLVNLAVGLDIGNNPSNLKVVDMGTGSGAIALSVASLRKDWLVYGLDVSPIALEMARENACRLNAPVFFYTFDLLSPFERDPFPPDSPESWAGFKLLISNPPYIPIRERPTLAEHVREFEPEQALFVPDTDPLIFYRRLLTFAGRFGADTGRVAVECHTRFAVKIREFWEQSGLVEVIMHEDTFGRPRFVSGIWMKERLRHIVY